MWSFRGMFVLLFVYLCVFVFIFKGFTHLKNVLFILRQLKRVSHDVSSVGIVQIFHVGTSD